MQHLVSVNEIDQSLGLGCLPVDVGLFAPGRGLIAILPVVDASLPADLTLCGCAFALVGTLLTVVSQLFTLVGDPFPLVSDPISPVGKQFTPSDLRLTVIESLLALIKRSGLASNLSGHAGAVVNHTSTIAPWQSHGRFHIQRETGRHEQQRRAART